MRFEWFVDEAMPLLCGDDENIRMQRMMGHSRIADDVIKEGIRNLIKENPKNYYLKNYLGSVL